MQTISIHQAKLQLSELIRAVEQGDEVVLTRHGKRVIRLVREPEDAALNIDAQRQAIQAELNALRAKVQPFPGGFQAFWKEAKRERDERGLAISWRDVDH